MSSDGCSIPLNDRSQLLKVNDVVKHISDPHLENLDNPRVIMGEGREIEDIERGLSCDARSALALS